MPFDPDKLAKFIAKKSSGGSAASQTGGKGSVRRKRKAVRKNASHDDKRLKNTLNKLNVRDIPAIEEVNLFKDDSTVIHFANPKVQASIAANTYVVSGNCETKKLTDLLPGIISQLGPDNLEELKKIYASYTDDDKKAAGGDDDDDDDLPELVDNFEDVSKGADADGEDDDDDDVPDLVQN
jgi:nascent polypeptide-associated complex subunit beta